MIGFNETFRRFLLHEIRDLDPAEINELENLFAARYQLLEEERISVNVRGNPPNPKRLDAIRNLEESIGNTIQEEFDNRFYQLRMRYMEERYRELNSGYLVQWPRDLKYFWRLIRSALPWLFLRRIRFRIPRKDYLRVAP